MGRDFVILGVDPSDPDPYCHHTGRKRDHGGEDAIEIIDLIKQFGRARILNGLNLGLPEGQVSMVLGPSGTGKSVLIKHIVVLLYPDSGDVLVHGESVPNMSDDELFEIRRSRRLRLFASLPLPPSVPPRAVPGSGGRCSARTSHPAASAPPYWAWGRSSRSRCGAARGPVSLLPWSGGPGRIRVHYGCALSRARRRWGSTDRREIDWPRLTNPGCAHAQAIA
ncbi:MAG TPA: ATP-binding cassette domain-containing protein [Solirubrobacterales bacterium]